MDENMTVRQGGRLSFTVNRADSSAISATFIMASESKTVVVTEVYDSEGKASFEIGSPDTDTVGTYNYQLNENFSTGSPDIYPSPDGCDGDCELPTVEICESLSSEES